MEDYMNIFIIDIGTSSMRGIFYDQNANMYFQKQLKTLPNYQNNGWVEQNPNSWKTGLFSLLKSLSDYCHDNNILPDVISLTAQRSSVIPVSSKGVPLANAIMWQDKRTHAYEKKLEDFNSILFSKSGSKVNSVFSACKMLWFKENMPNIYKHTAKFVVIPDYLLWLLTENFITDYTYGSRSLLMNLKDKTWDNTLLDIFQIDKQKLCELVPPGSICGYLASNIAKTVGLPQGIPIVSAGGDQQCAALGMGVLHTGNVELTAGTGAFLLAGSDIYPDNASADVIVSASAIPNSYLLESSVLACCSAYDWFLRSFYPECQTSDYSVINEEIKLSHKSPLIALPYFQGRATPDWNSTAEASFHHIDLSTTRGDFARAILEGICYEINCNLLTLKKYIGNVTSASICGGLTKNPLFSQLVADILNQKLCLYSNCEASALGAWMQGSIAIGLFNNYEDAFKAARANDTFTIFDPNTKYLSYYSGKQKDYELLYQKLYSK